jgi:hypothetical protein
MSVRVWAGPWVQDTFAGATRWKSQAEQYCTGGFSNFFPSNLDGSPASTWVITAGRAQDWTAAIADASLTDIFAGDLPGTINSRDDLIAFLRGRTVGDVPLARRQAIQANLDSLGVARADFTLTTPLWKVFQRIISTLFEKDGNFASVFSF